jgi:hypothetical protein
VRSSSGDWTLSADCVDFKRFLQYPLIDISGFVLIEVCEQAAFSFIPDFTVKVTEWLHKEMIAISFIMRSARRVTSVRIDTVLLPLETLLFAHCGFKDHAFD